MQLYYFSSGPRHQVLEQLIRAGHQIIKVFCTPLEKHPNVCKTIDLAKLHGIPVQTIQKEELTLLAQELDPHTLILSLGFAYLFPKNFVDAFDCILNVHGTLLPKYAGARTLNWVIENQESESGVTVHRVDYGMDTGPILLQKKFAVSPFDTAKTLYEFTLNFEPEVVLEALSLMEQGNEQFVTQESELIEYEDRTPAHSELDPKLALESLMPKINASHPQKYPAYFYYHGKKMILNVRQEEEA